MDPIRFRDADPTAPHDLRTVAEIGRATFIATFGPDYSAEDLSAFLEEQHSEAAVARCLADPRAAVRLVEDGEGLAGFALLAPNGLPHVPAGADPIEIKRFYLLPRLHGRGVADALMAWCLERGRTNGHDLMTLSVFSENHRAKAFYARHGFREVGSYLFRVGSQLDDERVWVRPLR